MLISRCMSLPYLTLERIQHFIQSALAEDVGEGDHSTLAAVPSEITQKAKLLVKADGILAGVALAQHIFQAVDEHLVVENFIDDGAAIKFGDIAFTVAGNSQSILSAERLVLNCMQRMSGIATYTHQLQSLLSHTSAKLLDTRKTTPNFRLPEKWAVAIGGGQNHRFALYDMIMLKDNHIDYAGGVREAIERTHRYLEENQLSLKVEVETRNLDEVKQVLEVGGVDVIMLDNMSLAKLDKAISLINGKAKIEVSCNINLTSIKKLSGKAIDYVSVGAITHSPQNIDLSLNLN